MIVIIPANVEMINLIIDVPVAQLNGGRPGCDRSGVGRLMYVDLRPDRPSQFEDSDSDPVEVPVSFGLLFCFGHG